MNIKDQYPALNQKIDNKEIVYFDNACAILKPKRVIDAITNYYNNFGTCAGPRGTYSLNEQTNDLCESSREKIANFISTSPNNIVWTKNSTEGINLVANSIKLNKDDEILTTSLEHHSNILPFYEQSKRNLKLKIVDMQHRFNIEKLKESISSKTKLISITHASNVTGEILPLKEICEIAHDKGIKVLSDDAQLAAHKKINVKESLVDFTVFSSHKLGGPTGIGALYIKDSTNLSNFLVGGGTVQSVNYTSNQISPIYLKDNRRFEAGLQNYSGIIGFGSAIDQINNLGIENIEAHEKKLASLLLSELKNMNVQILSNNKNSVPNISFIPNSMSSADVSLYMDNELPNHKIMLRAGTHCANPFYHSIGLEPQKGQGSVRASFFSYNTIEEIKLFTNNLKEILD